jgi:hypothetical protein
VGSALRTAILVSGGTDSTYCAWKTLVSTDDEVTLVFLNNKNVSDEILRKYRVVNVLETSANSVVKYRVQKIHRWLSKNVRSCSLMVIDLTEEMLIRDDINSASLCVYPILINMINTHKLDQIISSHEFENDGSASIAQFNNKLNVEQDSLRCARRFEQDAKRGILNFMLIDSKYTQATAYAEIPKRLFNLSVSCDSGVPCNTCFKCTKKNFFCEQIDIKRTSEEIYEQCMKQSMVNDKWWSMKDWLGLYIKSSSFPAKVNLRNVPVWPKSINKGLDPI